MRAFSGWMYRDFLFSILGTKDLCFLCLYVCVSVYLYCRVHNYKQLIHGFSVFIDAVCCALARSLRCCAYAQCHKASAIKSFMVRSRLVLCCVPVFYVVEASKQAKKSYRVLVVATKIPRGWYEMLKQPATVASLSIL